MSLFSLFLGPLASSLVSSYSSYDPLSLSVGCLSANLITKAVDIGISRQLMEDSDAYYSETLSDNQKKYEMKKLKNELDNEFDKLTKLNIDYYELSRIETAVNEYRSNNEYFNALKYINDIKLQYVQKSNESEVKNEIEILYERINKVREKSSKRIYLFNRIKSIFNKIAISYPKTVFVKTCSVLKIKSSLSKQT